MNLLNSDDIYLNLDPYLSLSSDYTSVPYSYFVFPGGEPHIKIGATYQEMTIIHRIKNFEDFGILFLAVDAIRRRQHNATLKLILPYFPSARQDRVKSYGEAEALTVAVYANLINSLKFDSVTIFDPHSDVCTALIHNIEIVDNSEYVAACIKYNGLAGDWVIVIPDMGAYKKAYELIGRLPESLKPSGVVVCTKHRNMNTGDITGTEIAVGREMIKGYNCVIVDDICDGGRTFIEIADIVDKYKPASLSLIVSHGIFSRGLMLLEPTFNRIFTTNSVVPMSNVDKSILSTYNVFTNLSTYNIFTKQFE